MNTSDNPKQNLWILTEERPKREVIELIIRHFATNHPCDVSIDNLNIIPIMANGLFQFAYRVTGVKCAGVNDILIKIVSGSSSFVDYIIFHQENEPVATDRPIYLIEETKTDDSESRNTGIFQRSSKFVFANYYYPEVKKIMYYNIRISPKETPTQTNIFGTRMLLTLGVEIMGKELDPNVFKPFENLDDFMQFRNATRKPPKGNTPIVMTKHEDKITISGKLIKAGHLSHDPNIGALTAIACCIRFLGWTGKIVITEHGLEQKHVGSTNKFIQIANKIGIELDGLTVPAATLLTDYWHYDNQQEKLGTIFLALAVEAYTNGVAIYENHGGAERGYLLDLNNKLFIAVPKYQEGMREAYKLGDKTQIINIPDLVILDRDNNEIVDVEGKKYSTRQNGIKELALYKYFDEKYLMPLYSPKAIFRTVAVYGSKETKIKEDEIGFMLNENGAVILGKNAPKIFSEAISKLG